jgi:AraC-like DNA-binding protein
LIRSALEPSISCTKGTAEVPTTFDLDDIEISLREAALHDLLGQIPVPIDVSTGAVDRLHVSTVSDFFGRLFLVSCNGRGALVHRGERRVAQDHERTMMLSVVTSGHSTFHQDNVVSDAGRGDVVAYCSTKPYSATFDNVAKYTFMIDYGALDLPDGVVESHVGQRINRGHVLGGIVSRYLVDLGSHAIYLPDADRQALEQPTIDLLRALFTATAGDETRAREPLHATLGVRMLEYLKMHLCDSDLNISRVAREHGISERYAYLILSRSGITLADWVRTQRLAGAARDLANTTHRQDTIAAIAYSWGFPDQANFTRAFRRVYGISPREYRRTQ